MTSEISVKELNDLISTTLTTEFNNIRVIGEVSNMKISNSHLYMTLKDEESSINVIMWRYDIKNKTIKIDLRNGDNLIIEGSLNLYIKSGTYNIIANNIIKNGIGELHKLYESNKIKYETLGYYANKKPQPKIFHNIGILTAVDGAALQDILFVLNKNNFKGNIYIKNCSVQGNNCPASIVSGIEYFEKNQNKYNLDALLITRGGGSFEDLIGFSDELIIESIKQCSIYTISAVGHEIDFMLSDFVADFRAPTPSIAGEIISSRWKQLDDEIIRYDNTLDYHKKEIIRMIEKSIDNIDNININTKTILQIRINEYKQRIGKLHFQIDNLNIQNILDKGYNILMDESYNIIDNMDLIELGQKLNIKLNKGELNVIVNNIKKTEYG
jgi:exodeoxyribonuclease VII large subunit